MGQKEETSQYKVHLITTTALAILVETDFGEEVWIPKKLIGYEAHKDGTCTITCTDKVAVSKRLA